MWKKMNGRLVAVTDDSRVKFRTNISKSLLNELQKVADEYDTRINYLLETGLQNILEQGVITFNKEARPKDRVQYKTTYDQELLEEVKKFAKNNQLFINDVIEYSTNFIDVDMAKKEGYKHRVE
ncbi:rRNA methyltransferase [Mesobacillus campisalis]|uniref:rRNA methyltransferase n=1 Tax=Mesobacillus campisalis TaxID=1408103 RepID=A0A0M2SYN2_9BACI|nr:hypothetical protein [Mesobacillus campisalis]KKK37725.1 rRNA methyltransferase [Mesobacillus campisalis]